MYGRFRVARYRLDSVNSGQPLMQAALQTATNRGRHGQAGPFPQSFR